MAKIPLTSHRFGQTRARLEPQSAFIHFPVGAKHLTSDDKGDPYNDYAAFFITGIDGLFGDYADTAVAARNKFCQVPAKNKPRYG